MWSHQRPDRAKQFHIACTHTTRNEERDEHSKTKCCPFDRYHRPMHAGIPQLQCKSQHGPRHSDPVRNKPGSKVAPGGCGHENNENNLDALGHGQPTLSKTAATESV